MIKINKNTLVCLLLKTYDEAGNLIEENDDYIYLHGGYGQIFQKLENELLGNTVGDTFNLTLVAEEAFGKYDESLIVKEALTDLPEDIELGMEFEAEDEKHIWVIEEIKDGYAILNANHELAGIPIRVSGTILEVEQLTEENAQKLLKMQHSH